MKILCWLGLHSLVLRPFFVRPLGPCGGTEFKYEIHTRCARCGRIKIQTVNEFCLGIIYACRQRRDFERAI